MAREDPFKEEREWLINDRDELMRQLAVSKANEREWERKLEVGELIWAKDVQNQASYRKIKEDNLDLNTIMKNQVATDTNIAGLIHNTLTYADILKNGTNRLAAFRSSAAQGNHEVANQSVSPIVILKRPLRSGKPVPVNMNRVEDLVIRFKVVNIQTLNTSELEHVLYEENGGIDIKVENVYEVKGAHRSYNNAIIMTRLTTASVLEEYPFLYERGYRRKVYKHFSLSQCSQCWDLNHYASQCGRGRHCKNCGSNECLNPGMCLSHCYQCASRGYQSTHKVCSYLCKVAEEKIYQAKRSNFL